MSSLRIPWKFLGSSLWVPLSSPRVPPKFTRSFLLELLKWITWLPWIDSIQVDITSSADNEQLVESLQINQGRWWVVWCWKIKKSTVRSQAVKTKFTGSALQASQWIKPYIICDKNNFCDKYSFYFREHSSITSSKRWVGGVRKWQFLMIYSTVNHQRVGWVGLKKSKTWWSNTWMVPYEFTQLINI